MNGDKTNSFLTAKTYYKFLTRQTSDEESRRNKIQRQKRCFRKESTFLTSPADLHRRSMALTLKGSTGLMMEYSGSGYGRRSRLWVFAAS